MYLCIKGRELVGMIVFLDKLDGFALPINVPFRRFSVLAVVLRENEEPYRVRKRVPKGFR